MVGQKFIDKIETLRHQTYSRLAELQKNLCPMVKDLYLNYQFEYWYDGYKYTNWEADKQVYAVNELPFCYDNDLNNTVFTDTLDNLVANSKVWPFLLFIEGVVIQWSKITVIHDYDYTYLKIADIAPTKQSFDAKIVVFPLSYHKIRYGEDNDVLVTADRKGFYFGTDGKRLEKTDFVDISLRLEIIDSDIYYKEVNLNSNEDTVVKFLEFTNLPEGFVPTLNNILTFTSDGSFNMSGTSTKISDIYKGAYGTFKILDNEADVKWAILMYNTKDTNTEARFVYSKLTDICKKAAIEIGYDITTEHPELWDDIMEKAIENFDFDHTFGNTYTKNIESATKYITRYDFALWKDVFKDSVNIKSFYYTGEEFKDLADSKGYVRFSRKHSDLIQDVALMFVNNKLYKNMIDVSYTNNTINLPIFGILDGDCVEVLLYTEANNNILDIKVEDASTAVYIHPDYNLEDCYIMSEYCPDAEYDVVDSLEKRKQYIVECTYTVDANSNYKINFTKDYYYGKDLKIVPKRQYRYYRYRYISSTSKIILPTQFNYCHDIDRYLIFINGKKIDRTEFTVTIMDSTKPFDKLVLYISTILDSGDYIDIFYIPEAMVEKYKQDAILSNGLLELEDTETAINYPTTYPLSKDTCMVFINGLKVNPLNIKDVSLNSMFINVDKYVRDSDGNIKKDGQGNPIISTSYVDSIDNVTIMEYIAGDKEVAGFLEGLYEQIPEGTEYDPSLIDFNKPASDKWKTFINTFKEKLPDSFQKLFFGYTFSITDPEEDYKNSFASLKSVLYDIIIDSYLSRSDVSTGDKFVYDFEKDYFDTIDGDTSGTKDITLVPDKDKLYDYETTDLIAQPEDVYEGQKFNSYNDQ